MDCFICKGNNFSDKVECGQKIKECLHCGVKFLNPLPNHEEVMKIYREDYFKSKDKNLGYTNYVKDENIHRINARHILKILSNNQNSHRKLIDIGCAYGFLLSEAEKLGWKVSGVEPCFEARLYAKERLLLKDIRKDIDEINKRGVYDACIMAGVIEHFVDPVNALHKVFSFLKSGSLLVIITADTDSAFPLKWKSLEHPVYFSRKSLKFLLNNSGFDLVFIKKYWATYGIEDFLIKLSRYIHIPCDNKNIISFSKKIIKKLRIPTNELICLGVKR